MRKSLFNGLGILQAFIGVGAVAGGLALVLDPSGATLGVPLELLEETPFATYLVPGIVLVAVNGLGSLAGAAMSFTRHRICRRDSDGSRRLPHCLDPGSGLLDGGVPLAPLALS